MENKISELKSNLAKRFGKNIDNTLYVCEYLGYVYVLDNTKKYIYVSNIKTLKMECLKQGFKYIEETEFINIISNDIVTRIL